MKTTVFKPTKATQAAKVTAKGNEQITEVCKMLGWTEDQYYLHQFEQYEDFIKRALHGSPVDVYNKVRYSALMRGLWNNAWIARNEDEFLPFGREFFFSGVIELEHGDLALYLPLDDTIESIVDEYEFVHHAMRLYNNHDFMCQFYHVLQLIAKS